MSGTNDTFPTSYLPFDNSGLRERLAEMPVRATSIEAELRTLMAERHQAEATTPKSKRRSRWD